MKNNKQERNASKWQQKYHFLSWLTNPYFIIAVGVFLFYGRLLFGDMPYTGDFLTYQLPEKNLIRECLQHGIMPYMNPYILSGTPMLANIATGSFYPLNLLLLFGSPVFGLNLFLFIHVLLAGWAMTLFVNRGLKIDKHIASLAGVSYSLGGCLWGMIDKGFIVSPWLIPLFFFGVIAFYSGNIKRRYAFLISVIALTFLFYSGNLLEAYFSIIIAGVGVIWWSLFADFAENDNSKQLESFILLKCAFRNIYHYVFIILTSIFLAAPQVVPTFKASLISYRATGVGVANAQHWSFPFMRIIEYIVPFAFGGRENGGMYFGESYMLNAKGAGGSPWFDSVFCGFPILCAVILFLIMALSSFIKQRKNEECKICHSFVKNRDLVLFAGLLFFFMLALGNALPLYQLCYVTLPGFNVFRHPEKYIEWVNIFLIIIGSYGLQKLLNLSKTEAPAPLKRDSAGAAVLLQKQHCSEDLLLESEQKKAFRSFKLIIFTILSLLITVLTVIVVMFLMSPEKYSLFFQEYGSRWDGEKIFIWQAGTLTVSIISLVLMFIVLRIYRAQTQKIIIAFIWISLLNFAYYSYRVDWTVPVETFHHASTWDNLLPEFDKSQWRIYASRQFKYIPSSQKLAIYTSLEDNSAALHNIRIPSGFSALIQQKYFDYFNFEHHPATRVLDLLSVKYIAAPLLPMNKIPEGCVLLKKDDDAQFMILENRNAIPRYSVYRKFHKANDMRDEIKKVFDTKTSHDTFALTELPENYNSEIELGKASAISIIKELPGKISLEVTGGPCWIVLRDWHSPGWSCVDDNGKNIPITSVEGGLMGVFIAKKDMILHFAYLPTGLNTGLLAGVLGLLLVLFGFRMYCQRSLNKQDVIKNESEKI